jgi:hypothetical protein
VNTKHRKSATFPHLSMLPVSLRIWTCRTSDCSAEAWLTQQAHYQLTRIRADRIKLKQLQFA